MRKLTIILMVIAAVALLAGTVGAAIIKYDFNDNDAVVDLNEFDGDGVTAGNIATTSGTTAGIDENRWHRKLYDAATATMSFTIGIPSDVTIDLTELSFIDGIDSGQGTNDTYSQWDLTISAGSGNPNSGTRSLTTGSTGVTSGSNTVTLSGLTGLTGTNVTFDFLVNYGVSANFDGGGNNNNRHAFLDDVTLTGTVIPEPASLALLTLVGGACFILRRRFRR